MVDCMINWGGLKVKKLKSEGKGNSMEMTLGLEVLGSLPMHTYSKMSSVSNSIWSYSVSRQHSTHGGNVKGPTLVQIRAWHFSWKPRGMPTLEVRDNNFEYGRTYILHVSGNYDIAFDLQHVHRTQDRQLWDYAKRGICTTIDLPPWPTSHQKLIQAGEKMYKHS